MASLVHNNDDNNKSRYIWHGGVQVASLVHNNDDNNKSRYIWHGGVQVASLTLQSAWLTFRQILY